MSRVEDLAEDLLNEYVTRKSTRAFLDLNLHHDGMGCQCFNCMNGVVKEWNSWIDFIVPEGNAALYKASIVWSRRYPKILMGFGLTNKDDP